MKWILYLKRRKRTLTQELREWNIGRSRRKFGIFNKLQREQNR